MKRILSGAAGLALIVFAIGFVASAARADTVTQAVGNAGTVTFSTDGGVLAFVRADAADGWTYTVDRRDGSHLKVTFRDAAGAEVEFEAELEDGGLTVGASDEPGSTTTPPGDDTTSTTEGDDDTTSTTMAGDDDSDDDSDDADDADDADDDADDADDDSDDSDDDSDDSDDADDDSDDDSGPGNGDDTAAPEAATYLAGPAGSVSVLFAGGEVSLTGIAVSNGWAYEIDHAGGSHVEVEFHGPGGADVEFRVDADQRVRVEID